MKKADNFFLILIEIIKNKMIQPNFEQCEDFANVKIVFWKFHQPQDFRYKFRECEYFL